jgi:hypothetical protein
MAQTVKPALSIIVILHRMSRQGENTLYSLSAKYQKNVSGDDYEVVIVENASDDPLGEERALAACGPNSRYYYRAEPGVSPVPAINFAFEEAGAEYVGLMIDGARMVTPRVVEHALLARKLFDRPLTIVPGYHIGKDEHHRNLKAGHTVELETQMLAEIDWKNNGYDLFNISCLCESNGRGMFHPYLESNCMFFLRDSFEKIGRADPRFNLPGGGSVNIYLYGALARVPGTRLVVLAGEGSFHQFHWGVSTSEVPDREAVIASHQANLQMVFGGPFKGMHREPVVLGVLPGQVQPFIKKASEQAHFRHHVCRKQGKKEWMDDSDAPLKTDPWT